MSAHDPGTMRMPDAALQRGQVARLLMQHRATLYGYIFACVRNHADAEDVLQNVCVAVTESIDRLTSEDGFLPWAREIARRRILAHRRSGAPEHAVRPRAGAPPRRGGRPRRGEAAGVAPAAGAHGVPGEAAARQPPPDRPAYDGSVEGADHLAGLFGRSVQSIYAQVKRIKQALRQCVECRLAAEG